MSGVTAQDRIAAMFAAAQARGEAALVTYLMAGDPDLATSKAAALACAEGGADLIEIGMPFSDPIADGPTIQRAAERSLRAGTTLADALSVAAHVRARSGVRLALMGYVNPVLSYGIERFFADAARSGVNAVILPDVPPEESGEVRAAADAAGVKVVFLLAPTSTERRRRARHRVPLLRVRDGRHRRATRAARGPRAAGGVGSRGVPAPGGGRVRR